MFVFEKNNENFVCVLKFQSFLFEFVRNIQDFYNIINKSSENIRTLTISSTNNFEQNFFSNIIFSNIYEKFFFEYERALSFFVCSKFESFCLCLLRSCDIYNFSKKIFPNIIFKLKFDSEQFKFLD